MIAMEAKVEIDFHEFCRAIDAALCEGLSPISEIDEATNLAAAKLLADQTWQRISTVRDILCVFAYPKPECASGKGSA